MQYQVPFSENSADTIEKYAQNYEEGTEKLRSSVEQERTRGLILSRCEAFSACEAANLGGLNRADSLQK